VHVLYKQKYNKDLVEVIESECGSKNFGQTLQFLALDPAEAECMMIHMATAEERGTNEDQLYPILCGRSHEDVEILKRTYRRMYDKDLAKVVSREVFTGPLGALFSLSLKDGEETFDAAVHTEEKVKEDTENFHNDGIGNWGTDEKGLFRTLVTVPTQHLEKMNKLYEETHGMTIKKALKKEMSGQAQDAATFLVGMKLHPHEEVAELLNNACGGFGTNELLLTCSLIRYQPIMKCVLEAYQEKYNGDLQGRIKQEVSGDYEALIMEVIKTGEELPVVA
jgi:hypothetical protein